MRYLITLALASTFLAPTLSLADSRIKGTGGVSSISGGGGGGLIPWATLGGLATREQRSLSGFITRADVDDFTLDVKGITLNLNNRIELSVARQDFTIKANNAEISQDKYGLKAKVSGDLIFGQMPQITLGLEKSHLRDPATARAVGARDDDGVDFYVSAAKAWIDGPLHRTSMLNFNLRSSKANQFGLLGYGGDDQDRQLLIEASAAMFLTRSIALGVEYRQKPDNLSALIEEDASDVFIAWFPNKHFSVTAAYVRLGDIAGAQNQNGYYLSIQGAL
ncbi:MAG: DUF3034 family protein [Gammaproteobacteria bacterium]